MEAADITGRVGLRDGAGLGLGGVLRRGGCEGVRGRGRVSLAERCCNGCRACAGAGAHCSCTILIAASHRPQDIVRSQARILHAKLFESPLS